MTSNRFDVTWTGIIMLFAFWLTCIISYVGHIVWSFNVFLSDQANEVGYVVLAVLGIVFPPIGVIHGFCWFTGITG